MGKWGGGDPMRKTEAVPDVSGVEQESLSDTLGDSPCSGIVSVKAKKRNDFTAVLSE